MKLATPYRSELLALCLVLMPLTVLTAVTWRLTRQERELGVARRGEQRALLTAQLAQRMLATLERRRSQSVVATPSSAGRDADFILLSTSLSRGRLSLPWERGTLRPPGDDEIEALLREGERLEFTAGRPELAADRYAAAGAAARIPARRLDAALRQARALGTAGQREASMAAWRGIAVADPTVVDEEGMPFALYGAEALLAGGHSEIDTALDAVESTAVAFGIVSAADPGSTSSGDRAIEVAGSRFDLPPPALLAMRAICERLADEIGRDGQPSGQNGRRRIRLIAERLEEEVDIVERLRSLRRDLPALLSMASRSESGSGFDPVEPGSAGRGPEPGHAPQSSWLPYGPDPWLVTVTDAGGVDRVLVADSHRVLAALTVAGEPELADAVAAVHLTTAPGPDAKLLGPSFPGLFASFPERVLPASGSADFGRMLTFVVLPLVLGITAIATFLLLRDVRREVVTAGLRAEFVASVSHELKTPLTSIRMFAETLLLGRQRTPDESHEYLETIVHESERLSRLIDNVLDFSRIERDERIYRFNETPLDVVIRDAAQAMSYPLAQSGHALRVSIVEPPPVARADVDALTRAVLNLLSNAVKFSAAGDPIDLELDRVRGEVVIRVRDRGRGIEAREHGSIFQRFYRTTDALADGTPGTGLGLALVDHVARAHEGSVEVDSEPGRGSTFTIRIPESSARSPNESSDR